MKGGGRGQVKGVAKCFLSGVGLNWVCPIWGWDLYSWVWPLTWWAGLTGCVVYSSVGVATHLGAWFITLWVYRTQMVGRAYWGCGLSPCGRGHSLGGWGLLWAGLNLGGQSYEWGLSLVGEAYCGRGLFSDGRSYGQGLSNGWSYGRGLFMVGRAMGGVYTWWVGLIVGGVYPCWVGLKRGVVSPVGVATDLVGGAISAPGPAAPSPASAAARPGSHPG